MQERSPAARLLENLSSLNLTVGLFGVWIVLAMGGTLLPAPAEVSWTAQLPGPFGMLAEAIGLDDFFHSLPFRAVTAALVVNLLACTIRRTGRGITGYRSRGTLPGHMPAVAVETADPDGVAGRLVAAGYRIRETGGETTAHRWGLWSFRTLLAHLSLPLVVLGGLVSSLGGYVGTTWVPEGGVAASVYDWGSKTDRPLPFELFIKRFDLAYHPTDLKVGVRWKESGEKSPAITTRTGEPFAIPGTDDIGVVTSLDRGLTSAVVEIRRAGAPPVTLHTGQEGTAAPLPYEVVLIAHKDAIPRSLTVDAILAKDGLSTPAPFGINDPLFTGPVTVTMTAWNAGQGVEPWLVGLQVVSSPGLPVVWAGLALLTAGICAYLVPVREAKLVRGEGGARLVVRGLTTRERLLDEARRLAGGAGA